MYKGLPISKSAYYRRKRKATILGCEIMDVPNMQGKHGHHAKGNKNGRWNKGILLSSHGYVLVRVSKNHPLAFGNGYAYKHDLVMYNATGLTPAMTGKIVHHKNDKKQDNRLENLEWKSSNKHIKEHQLLLAECKHDRTIVKILACKMIVCDLCGRTISKYSG